MNRLSKKKKEFEERLKGRNRTLWEAFLFLLRVTVLAAPLYALLWADWNPVWLRSLEAGAAHTVLQLLGLTAQHQGTVVATPSIAVDVSTDSTGWKSLLALSALILAVRGRRWRQRLIGIAVGCTLVFAANMLRLISMIYAVEVWNIPYQLIHTFLWRWGLTAVVFLVWLGWLYWSAGDQEAASADVSI